MLRLSKEVKSTTQPQSKGRFPLLYEAVVVLIVWLLNIQLHVQSVHITTNVVSSNPTQVRCTRYIIMWKSLQVICGRSVCFPVSCTNKTDRHDYVDITEILLKVALSIIILTLTPFSGMCCPHYWRSYCDWNNNVLFLYFNLCLGVVL